MSESKYPTGNRQLDEILAEYLRAAEAGESPNQEELIRRYPEFADQLREFFTDKQQIDDLAKADPNKTPVDATAPTLPPTPQPHGMPNPPSPPLKKGGEPSVGESIRYFGDFELLEEIARGGMGVVYKARQVSLNRIVALKMILTGQLASEEDVKRFRAEAEAAANLDHPGIVPIFEVGEHQGQHYFSMGFVEGESLADKIKDGPLPPRFAAQYVEKIADAVAYAHSQGVIHRDLKPGNVLLATPPMSKGFGLELSRHGGPGGFDSKGEPGEFGVPKVTDFGLAKRVEGDSDLTASGQILGTPSYMSPEQAGGKTAEINERSDVYALGAILYALITGRPPFQADNSVDTLIQVLQREPTAPRQLNPKIPKDLETIALKCLEKEARKRYHSVGDMREELRRFIEGAPITARPVSSLERSWRWCKRKPVMAGLIAAVVALLITGTAVSSYFAIKANRRAILAEERELMSRRHWYVSDIRLAEQALEADKGGRLLAILQRQIPEDGQADLRGFEWHYLWRVVHAHHRQVDVPYDDGVGLLTASPDAKYLATSSRGLPGQITIWTRDGQQLMQLTDISGSVRAMQFSPVKPVLATISSEQKTTTDGNSRTRTLLEFWDINTGKKLRELEAWDPILAFSPDGRWLATSSDPTKSSVSTMLNTKIRILDAHTLRATSTSFRISNHLFTPQTLHFSRDGQALIGGGLGFEFNPASSMAQGVFDMLFQREPSEMARRAAEQQRRLMDTQFSGVAFWDVESGECKGLYKGENKTGVFQSLATSPDGLNVAAGVQDGSIHLIDVQTAQATAIWSGYDHIVGTLTFSPDGKILASTSPRSAAVKLWNASSGEHITTLLGHAGGVVGSAFVDAGQTLVTAGTRLQFWDPMWLNQRFAKLEPNVIANGSANLVQSNAASHFGSVAFSPDSQSLAWGIGSAVTIWDCKSRDQIARLDCAETGDKQRSFPMITAVQSLAFSPNGLKLAALVGFPSRVIVWELVDGQWLEKYREEMPGVEVSWIRDSDRLIAGNVIIDCKSWEKHNLPVGENSNIVSAAAVDDDIVIACQQFEGRTSNRLAIVDISNGETVRELDSDDAYLVVTAPAAGTAVSGYPKNGSFKIWDLETGAMRAHCRGTDQVRSLSISSDGRRVATASFDQTVKLWDVATGQELMTFSHRGSMPLDVQFSPDGENLAIIWSAGPISGSLLPNMFVALYQSGPVVEHAN